MLLVKRVVSETLYDEVFALRYRAYRSGGAVDFCTSGRFSDKYDDRPNQITWALTEADRVVGSIRTMWCSAPPAPQRAFQRWKPTLTRSRAGEKDELHGP